MLFPIPVDVIPPCYSQLKKKQCHSPLSLLFLSTQFPPPSHDDVTNYTCANHLTNRIWIITRMKFKSDILRDHLVVMVLTAIFADFFIFPVIFRTLVHSRYFGITSETDLASLIEHSNHNRWRFETNFEYLVFSVYLNLSQIMINLFKISFHSLPFKKTNNTYVFILLN